MTCVASILLFAGSVMALSPQLSFFQDEWSLLQAQDGFLGGAFVSHMGHFFPIGRFTYWIETQTFGSWYGGFLAVNASIHATNVILMDRWIRKYSGLAHSLTVRVALGLAYLTAISNVYSIQFGMQVKWHLSIFASLLLLNVVGRDRQLNLRVVLLVVLTALVFSSTAMTLLLLVAVLAIGGNEPPSIRLSSALIFSAVGSGVMGNLLARVWPPSDTNARGWTIEVGELLLSWQDVISWTSALALAWLVAPVSVVGLSHRAFISEVGEYLRDHTALAGILWLMLLVLLGAVTRGGLGKLHFRVRPLLVLGAMVFSSFLTVVFRYNNTRDFLAVRYGPLLTLLSVFFWALLILHVSQSDFVRVIQRCLTFLVVLTAVVGVVRFVHTVQTASDESRISATKAQLIELSKCRATEDIFVDRSIQNSLTGEEMCEIAVSVRGLVP